MHRTALVALLAVSVPLLPACGSDEAAGAPPGGSLEGGTGGAIEGGADSTPDQGSADGAGTLTDRIEQYGITWQLQSPALSGTFANGDPWVVGPVTLTAISPDYDGDHHGWEVNPSDNTLQGFDARVAEYDASRVPALPYVAAAGESLVKAVSLEPLDDADCRPCLRTAAVLTVLDSPPPDEGATTFRPPYFGEEKPLYSTTALLPERLPSLTATASAPALSDVEAAFQRVQLDHKENWTGRAMHPSENLPDYGSSIASRNAEGALRLMLDDAIEAKQSALVYYVQYGIDLAYMLKGGVHWPPNGGHSEGRKLPVAFAAVLLGDAELEQLVSSSLPGDFGENGGVYESAVAGEVLYGQGQNEDMYWENLVFDTGSRTLNDPYGWIDGGHRPGDSYQFCCLSKPWKSTATALLLLPELATAWNQPQFVSYVERWVSVGAWAAPDPCAPPDGVCAGGDQVGEPCTLASEPEVCTGTDAVCDVTVNWDANYGVTYGPDGQGGCILDEDPADGTGRFPLRHGAAADDGYYGSAFADEMWTAYHP